MATTPPVGSGAGGTASTPATGSGTSAGMSGGASSGDNTGGGSRRRRRGGRGNTTPSRPRYEGKTEEIKDHVFDVGVSQSGNELFGNTTKEIGEYIARSFKGGGEFLMAFDPDNLGFDPLTQPASPGTGASSVDLEIWKLEYKEYKDKTLRREELIKQAFSVVYGQCSQALRDRLEADSTWKTISASTDVIALLKLIRTSMHTGATAQQPTQSMQEAEDKFMSFRQGQRMSVTEYLTMFRNYADVYEHFGGAPGQQPDRIKANLVAVDPDKPTPAETEAARQRARDEYLGVRFLRSSNPKKYSGLIADLVNSHTRGQDEWPKTLTKAYEMLVNYRDPSKTQSFDPQDGGFSFYQQGDSSGRGAGRSAGRGSTGSGGRGGQGRGGAGRGSAAGSSAGRSEAGHSDQPPDTPSADDNSTTNQGVASYLPPAHSFSLVRAECVLSQQAGMLPQKWLLLDSCSSVDLISNDALLHNIHRVDEPLILHCNAGTIMVHQKGYLGTYPHPVWYSPNGIANVLSLNNVAAAYRVTMDTEVLNAFHLHRRDGTTLLFAPSGKGLYHHCLDDATKMDSMWSLLSTVARRADKYTKRAYKSALAARKFQNIIMRPPSRLVTDVALKHLGSPLTKGDVRAADDIFGPNLGALKGKTVHRPNPHVRAGVEPVPSEILRVHKSVTLSIDIMFVNKIPFFVTISRNLKFGTVDVLPNRRGSTLASKLTAVLKLYRHRGFRVTTILADQEFEQIRPSFPMINCCAADEHVPDVERYIRTIKDRARSCHRMLPFRYLPRIVLIHLIRNSVFWLNALPAADGVSSEHSPRYLMTGRELTHDKHVKLEFGAYVQTHEEHTNDMTDRTMGAICLGPTGNEQGGHWFMSLTSGARVVRHRWTELPMPAHVIARVSYIGRNQGMPATVTYSDRHGEEIRDGLGDFDDDYDSDDDSTYASDSSHDTHGTDHDDDALYDDDSDYASSDEDDQSEASSESDDYDDATSSDDEDDDSAGDDADGPDDPLDASDADDPSSPDHSDDRANDRHQFFDEPPPAIPALDSQSASSQEPQEWESWSASSDDVSLDADESVSDDEITDLHQSARADTVENPGVGDTDREHDPPESPGVGANADDESEADDDHDEPEPLPTLYEQFQNAVQAGREAAEDEDAATARPSRRQRQPGEYIYLLALLETLQPEDELFCLVSAQMSATKGLQVFGDRGEEALMKELRQVLYRRVFHPKKAGELTIAQKRAALKYLMFLKEKRSGDVKGRGCADGRKQRVYKTKEETSSPTVSIEALMISCMIDALEERISLVCDIPNAFMQAEIDELLHVKFQGELVDILIRIDPSYAPYVTMERGKKVIYVQLDKALYGTMQAALLFWEKLSSYLTETMGFVINPYDRCVANKTIDGKQCTIVWYVDDLKISHVDNSVVESVFKQLSAEFGKEAPLSVSRGKVHKYLGMTIDYRVKGQVKFSMPDYVDEVIKACPDDLKKGPSATPAANHLFNVNDRAEKLDDETAKLFHHLTAKLLYLCKRTRPDLQTAVSFLSTRVQAPDVDDYKKLGRCMRYLRETSHLALTLQASGMDRIQWWVDASFGVHPDLKSHTGATISLGKGAPFSKSQKQKINTRSSTEAELVGVNDAMGLILWTRKFLEAQGYSVSDNVVFQDNQSAMLLENNGTRSSSKRTRHMDIRYYFVTDNVRRKEMRVAYCPTEDMVADFFTKPLQGSAFRKHRKTIMNLPDDDSPPLLPQECVEEAEMPVELNKSLKEESAAAGALTSAEGKFGGKFGSYANAVKRVAE